MDGRDRLTKLIPFPNVKQQEYTKPKSIDLNVDDETLMKISSEGLLALNLVEMSNSKPL